MKNDIIKKSQKNSRIIVFTMPLVFPGKKLKFRKDVQFKSFMSPCINKKPYKTAHPFLHHKNPYLKQARKHNSLIKYPEISAKQPPKQPAELEKYSLSESGF